MEDVHELQLHIRGSQDEVAENASSSLHSSEPNRRRRWWLTLALCTLSVLVGQTAATLLGRFYYDRGGKSKWMAALVTTAGFPLLVPVLLLSSPRARAAPPLGPYAGRVALTYLCLGLAGAADNLMYSYGLLYLPVSTFSLVCATQLAFNAVFSYLLNSHKLTAPVVNSVVLLTSSAALLAASSPDAGGASSHVPEAKYPLGYLLTLAASALFSLILSSTQLAFQKVLEGPPGGFSAVLEMLVCVSFVSTAASVVGLFASGEWRGVKGEMEGFAGGEASYLATLVSIAVCWIVSGAGGTGLTFAVSSLFSNVISTLGLPVVPLFAVAFFRDRMDGVKVAAMLIAIWGFLSYIYQDYLDYLRTKEQEEEKNNSCATNSTAHK